MAYTGTHSVTGFQHPCWNDGVFSYTIGFARILNILI